LLSSIWLVIDCEVVLRRLTVIYDTADNHEIKTLKKKQKKDLKRFADH